MLVYFETPADACSNFNFPNKRFRSNFSPFLVEESRSAVLSSGQLFHSRAMSPNPFIQDVKPTADVFKRVEFEPGKTSAFYGFTATSDFVDVVRRPEEYEIIVDLPCRTKNDVQVKLNERIMALSVTAAWDGAEDKSNGKRGRGEGATFRVAFQLPDDVLTSGISARIHRAALTVVLPRQPA